MKDFEKEFERIKKYRYLPGLPLLTFGILDARTSLRNLNHYPKCGVKLQSLKFY